MNSPARVGLLALLFSTAALAQITITTPPSLPHGVTGNSYNTTLTATGGDGFYFWSQNENGSLPPGLSLSSDGSITGTPSVAGSFTFGVIALDTSENSANQDFTIVVDTPLVITTSTPLNPGTRGAPYTGSLSASGGFAPYVNWSVVVGSLPPGVSLNSSTGGLSGIPTATGTFNFTAQVQDSAGNPQTATKAFSITIVAPPLSISTASPLPAGTVSTPYSQTLTAAGGTPPYVNWTVITGSLPAGLTLNASTGAITGTPTTAGTSNFTVQVQDSAGTPQTASKAFALTVNPATLTISTASPLPAGTVSASYSQTLAATGGTPPYVNWTVITGSLPAGLTLNASTGAISGTPTTAGTSNFTVQVQDSAGTPQTASKAFALTVSPATLTISTATPLPSGAIVPYSQTLTATGGTPPYINWTLSSGALPSGVTLNSSTGAITGTPAAPGTFNFSVQVTDSATPSAQTATKAFSLTIAPGTLVISTVSPLNTAIANSPYSNTLSATGGTAPFTWSITTGSLPAGLTLNASTGEISGTPTTAGQATFTVRVQDSSGQQQTATKSLTLPVVVGPLTIQTANPLTPATQNSAYTFALTATGGVTPYANWTITSGALPPGLTLNASTGVISGTPTTLGRSNFVVQVGDASTPRQFAAKALSLTVYSTTLTIRSNSLLPSGVLNQPYNFNFAVTGGTQPYSFVLTTGNLPPGLTLTSGGSLTGVPVETGTYTFGLEVFDGAGSFGLAEFAPKALVSSPSALATQTFTIHINSVAVAIAPATLPDAVTNAPYSQTLTLNGGTPSISWFVASGSLPAGMSLSSSGGVISGTPTASGISEFTVVASDQAGNYAVQPYELTVGSGRPTITTTDPLPNGLINTPYSVSLTTTGGLAPYVYFLDVASTLPPGLSLTSAGVILGTPTVDGSYAFVVQVLDAAGRTDSKFLTLFIDLVGPPTISTGATLSNGIVGAPYAQTFVATGGTPPYSWSLATGSLPAGLTLSSAGVLSGTPTQSRTSTFTVSVMDTRERTANKTFSLTVTTPSPLAITTASLPGGSVTIAYSQPLAATGGVPPYSWGLSSGTLPPGLAITSGGVIQGTPSTAGTYTFSPRVTDRTGVNATRQLSITIASLGPVITTTALPAGQALIAYSFALASIGGTPPYTYSVSNGSIPSGFILTPDGQIFGTAGDALSATFDVRVTDRAGLSSARQFTLNIAPRQSPGILAVEIATANLPQGNVDKLYAFVFTARNGAPPYSWAISGLPAGLEANAQGEILGTPQRAGTSLVQVVVTDDARGRAAGTFNLVIKPPQVTIHTERTPDGRVNEPYSATFTATGGSPPYTFGIVSGTLPPGVAISNAGVVSGTPTSAGSYQFAVQATDSAGEKSSRGFALVIKPPPLVITTTTLGNGVVAFPFTAALAATGGTPPYKWSATGLPDGVTLDSATGAITGTPTKNGAFPVSVQVTDQDNQNASRSYPVEVATQLSITTTSVGPLVVGTPVSTPLAVAGGKPPYSWSVQSGSLPAGVTLGADGVISGTPTETGDSNFTAQVRDANNTAVSKSFAVRVATPLVLTTQTIPAAPFGAAYSTSFTATGGTPPYTWSIVSGSLPAGLTLSSAGTLSGTTTASGTSNFTVQVVDAGAARQTVQRAFSLQTQLPDISGLNVTVPQNPQPGQQSNIALAISSPYPVEVTGTLTLSFAPNAANNADDPAIQFSTGGRTVEFTIPAGQTQAVFRVPNLGVQTGTTAGTITLATSLQAAGTPVNCNCQLSQTIVIPRTAPTLSAVRVTRTGTGLNIVVTGFSTTREVTQGTFRFAGTTNLQTTELTVALTATFNTYFQSTAASQFGGQFTLTIPFTIQGDTATVNSVTVVLTNAVGSSQPVTATF